MTQHKKKIVKLSKGQIAPELIERTDLGILDTSGQIVHNFQNSKYGLFSTSKSTKYEYNFGANKKIKLLQVQTPDGIDTLLVLDGTAQKMYLVRNGSVVSNQIDVSAYFDETTYQLAGVAQSNEYIIIYSRGENPLLQLTVTKTTLAYSISIGLFEIESQSILKAANIKEYTETPIATLLAGALPVDTSGIAIGAKYLPNAPTPPSATFPWTLKVYGGIDDSDPDNPQPIWTDETYTARAGDLVQYQADSSTYAYSGSTWQVVQNNYTSDTDYSGNITPSATTGQISITLTGFTMTAPAGIDPLTYAKNKLLGLWIIAKSSTGVAIINEIAASSVAGQTITITKVNAATLVAFVNTSATSGYTIQFSKQRVFDSDYPGTPNNPEGTSNYPLTALFYQQRLIIGGTKGNPIQIVCSVQGSYNDFNNYENVGNLAFQLVIGSTEKEEIQNILLNQGVQIFTDKSEWLISGETLSQSSGFVRNSQIGSSSVQPIISANGSTLFVPRDGLGVTGFTYTYESASYATPQISLLTNIFNSPIIDMVLRKGYSTTDDTLICLCLENGRLIIGNYLQDQQIQAFVDRSADNVYFKQSIQVDRVLYFLVERNGTMLLERESELYKTACAIPNPTYNSTTGTISGLAIYNGQKINIYDGDGIFVESGTVANGTYVLNQEAFPATISEVGYNIHSVFESNPINAGIETLELYKTIYKIGLALTDRSKTEYVTINGKYGRKKGNLLTFIRPTRPSRDCRFIIENDIYPIDIMSVEIDYEA